MNRIHASARVLLLSIFAATMACAADPKAVKAKHVASAEGFTHAGQIAEAIVEYRAALQADPLDGALRLKLADLYTKKRDVANAVREYVRAADVLLDRPDVQIRAGNLLLFSGRYDDARVRAEKALAVAPKSVEAQILLANALAGLKDFDAAIAQIEEAIRLEPGRGATYANLGVLETGRGRTEAAERAFKKATELDDKIASPHLALANFLWSQGRWEETEEELSKALAVDPHNPLTHRAMASLAVVLNRPEDAEQSLKKAFEITKSPEAALALADFYVMRNNEPAARDILKPLVSSGAGSAQAKIRLAALDHRAGRAEAAYAALREVLTKNPTDLQALLTRAALLQQDGRLPEALVDANAVVHAHGDSAAAFMALGRVQTARNRVDEAISAYQSALKLNPRATAAQIALARLHLAAGHSVDSMEFAEDAVKNEPENPDARLVLVRGLIASGNLDRADSELVKLATRFPNVAAVHVQKGMLLGRKNDLAGARREFEDALKLAPNSLEAIGGLVALDLSEKNPVAAQSRVNALLSTPDPSAATLLLAARTSMATGDNPTAERLFRRVLQKDPAMLSAYAGLGQLYVRERRLDEALREFDSMATRDARPVAPLTLAGMILQSQGKTAEAQARFERALRVDPSAPVAANNLAWILSESGGNLDVALGLAQTAKRGLSNSSEVDDTLGMIYYRKNLFSMAIPAFKASVERDPSVAVYHYHLGLAQAKSGATAPAREALGRALALDQNFPGAADARRLLESLDGSN